MHCRQYDGQHLSFKTILENVNLNIFNQWHQKVTQSPSGKKTKFHSLQAAHLNIAVVNGFQIVALEPLFFSVFGKHQNCRQTAKTHIKCCVFRKWGFSVTFQKAG